jgi:hypothetical protein
MTSPPPAITMLPSVYHFTVLKSTKIGPVSKLTNLLEVFMIS